MKLVDNWRHIAKKAWSVKFSIISALLSACELGVQFLQSPNIPSGAFAALAVGVSLAAGLARLVAQQEISGGKS